MPCHSVYIQIVTVTSVWRHWRANQLQSSIKYLEKQKIFLLIPYELPQQICAIFKDYWQIITYSFIHNYIFTLPKSSCELYLVTTVDLLTHKKFSAADTFWKIVTCDQPQTLRQQLKWKQASMRTLEIQKAQSLVLVNVLPFLEYLYSGKVKKMHYLWKQCFVIFEYFNK